MAINTQKFLPPSKKSQNFIVPIKNVTFNKGSSKEAPKTSKDSEDLKTKLIDIDKLLKSFFSNQKKEDEKKRKEKENAEFKQREDKLEEKKIKGINVPKPGKGMMGNIFDKILRFFLFTALGWLVPHLVKILPTLIQIAKVLGSVYKFFEDIFGKLLDTFAWFLELGFGIQDKIRDGIKAIGGEGAAKVFDNFNGALTALVNTLLITGMVFSSGISNIIGDLLKNGSECCCPDPLDLLEDVAEGGSRALRGGLSSTRNVQKGLRANPLFQSLRQGRNLANINRLTGIAAEGVQNFGRAGQRAIIGIGENAPGLKNILKALNETNEGKGVARFIKTALRSGLITPEQAIQIGERGRGFGQQTLRTAGAVGKNIFQNLGNIKDQAVSGIRSGAGRAVNAVRTSAVELGERFLVGGKEVFSRAGDALNGINRWGESIGKGIKNIAEVAKNPSLLAEKAKDLISKSIGPQIEKNPLIKNIVTMVKNPGEAAKTAGGLIKTALKNKEILSVADYLKKVRSTAKGSLGPIDKIIAVITALIDYVGLGTPFINATFGSIGGLLGYTAGFAIGAPFGGVPGFVTGAAGGFAGEFIGKKLAESLGSTPLAKIKDPNPLIKDGRMLVQPTGDNAKVNPETITQKPGDTKPKPKPQGTAPGTTQKTEKGGLILSINQKEQKDVSTQGQLTRGGNEVGGQLTRGGKEVGGKIGRTLKMEKKKLEVPSILKLPETIVGRDISGGKQSIIDLYGGNDVEDDKKNGYLTLVNSAKILKDIPFGIGSIMGSVVDMMLGQRPTDDVTGGLSQGIAYLINGVKSGGGVKDLMGNFFGFADGGEVTSSIPSILPQDQITPETISRVIESPVQNKINEIFRTINEQSLKPNRSESSTATGGTSTDNKDAPQDKPEPIGSGSGSGGVVQWLHGNPNRPGYDRAGHGSQKNAHDHFGFSSREFAVKGFNALKKAGYSPYEFEGITSVGKHYPTGGHYGPVGSRPTYGNTSDGSAFDVPWSTPPYGMSGELGPKDYRASDNAAKIVGALSGGSVTTKDEKSKAGSAGKFHGGFINKGGIEKVHDKEYVVDADSVSLFGKDFFEKINKIENRSQLISQVPSLVVMLKKVGDNSNIKTPSSSPIKNEQSVEKMIAGGQVSEIKSSVPKINRFASYDQPSSGGRTIYVQPYIIEKPSGGSSKTMGFSYIGNIEQTVNDRISSLLRN